MKKSISGVTRVRPRNGFVKNPLDVKLPKFITMFFILIQFLFGFDTGFSEAFEDDVRNFVKRFTTLMTLLMLTVFLSPVSFSYESFFFWSSVLKFVLTVLALLRTKYNMYEYLYDVHSVKKSSGFISNNFFPIIMIVYTFGMFGLKWCVEYYRCIFHPAMYCDGFDYPVHHIIYTYCIQGCDCFGGVLTVIQYYALSTVTFMKNNLFTKMTLRDFEDRYVALADNCTKIKWFYDAIMVIELCINTPRLLVTLWRMLAFIKNNAQWFTYTGEWLFAFHLTIQICIPSLIAEMVFVQMTSIKTIINEQRRIENDKEKAEDLTRVLRYIKACTLEDNIFRVMPVDLSLPIGLLNLCTTYFIVILQFTHLYD